MPAPFTSVSDDVTSVSRESAPGAPFMAPKRKAEAAEPEQPAAKAGKATNSNAVRVMVEACKS